jgi:uncharacterized protein YkwD
MVANGFFDHKDSRGEGPSARAAKAGYPRPVSEALAWGQKSAADAVRAWLQSPEHCRSVLSTAALEAGFATATAEDGPRWVALFGR